jgi:Holliday junction resolvase RusA-like endonuclease
MSVQITVYGVPAPKGSRIPGRRRNGTIYTRPASKNEHAWTEAVAEQAAWRVSQATADHPMPSAPYRVVLDFYCERPAKPSHPHPSRHDLDKLARAVLDGLVRGGLLTDDRHVVVLEARKQWATASGGEGVRVQINELDMEAAA